jgi:hypothetical protein
MISDELQVLQFDYNRPVLHNQDNFSPFSIHGMLSTPLVPRREEIEGKPITFPLYIEH